MPKVCIMSMLTFKCQDPTQSGIVEKNKQNIMLDFIEKPLYSKNRNANAGVFFMKSDFIKFVKSLKKPVFDFSNDIIPYFAIFINRCNM